MVINISEIIKSIPAYIGDLRKPKFSWDFNCRFTCLPQYLSSGYCVNCHLLCFKSYRELFNDPKKFQLTNVTEIKLPPLIARFPTNISNSVIQSLDLEIMQKYTFTIPYPLIRKNFLRKLLTNESIDFFIDHAISDFSLVNNWNPEMSIRDAKRLNRDLLVFSSELGINAKAHPQVARGIWNYSVNTYQALQEHFSPIFSIPSSANLRFVEKYFSRVLERLAPAAFMFYIGGSPPNEYKQILNVIKYLFKVEPELNLVIFGMSSPSRILDLIEIGVKSFATHDWIYKNNFLFHNENWFDMKEVDIEIDNYKDKRTRELTPLERHVLFATYNLESLTGYIKEKISEV